MLLLKRTAYTSFGTFGVAHWSGIPFALTLERRWFNNERSKSCIPKGTYECIRCRESAEYGYQDSPTFGDTFVVTDVPGRSQILFHKGNLEDDTHGCILIGEQFEYINGAPAVLASKKGFDEFKHLTIDLDRFTLCIED